MYMRIKQYGNAFVSFPAMENVILNAVKNPSSMFQRFAASCNVEGMCVNRYLYRFLGR